MFKVGTVLCSDRRALNLFAREAEAILEMVDETDIHLASQQILIPRLAGIEDSSRNWSILMVLDHLCLVNLRILETIKMLKTNLQPLDVVNIAEYKPDADVDMDVVDRFTDVNARYSESIGQLMPLRTRFRHHHPWFGQLDAHAWHCLAAVHMRIHRRQARKILNVHGMV